MSIEKYMLLKHKEKPMKDREIICLVVVNEAAGTKCSKKFKGGRTFNFSRHLQREHKNVYDAIAKADSELLAQRRQNNPFRVETPATESQREQQEENELLSDSATSADLENYTDTPRSSTPADSGLLTEDINSQEEVLVISPPPIKKKKLNCTVQTSMSEYVEIEKNQVLVNISYDTIVDGLIELVTKNGRPNKIVKDSGLLKILRPLFRAFPGKPAIYPEKIPALISQKADKVKVEVTGIFGKIMFSLKTDAVTRLEQGFIGVNVQTIKNGKIIIRCLGCVILEKKHTGQYISEKIQEILTSFGLSLNQVYSITYDNGRNMVKAGKLLSDEAAEMLMEDITALQYNENNFESEAEEDDYDSEDEYYEGLNETQKAAVKEAKKKEKSASKFFDKLMHNALESMASLCVLIDKAPLGINDLRCVAHTLQLVVEGVFKKLGDPTYDEEASLLVKVKEQLKFLRTPAIRRKIDLYKKHNPSFKFKLPVLDNDTRWMSTYNMLVSCIQCRMFCENEQYFDDYDSYKFTGSEYEEVEEIVAALEPLQIATLQFQKEQLTIPCMALTWTRSKAALKVMTSNFADMLYREMEIREETLFSQIAVLCALYMDPRTNVLVPVDAVKKVQEHLLFLSIKAQALKCQIAKKAVTNIESDKNCSESTSQNTDDILEKEMQEIEAKRRAELLKNTFESFQPHQIETQIKEFQNTPRLNSGEDVLMFWETKKFSHPALYDLAQIVLAAPPTQVSVERLFSGLKFILSPLRNGMKPENVNNIMIIRTNEIFADK